MPIRPDKLPQDFRKDIKHVVQKGYKASNAAQEALERKNKKLKKGEKSPPASIEKETEESPISKIVDVFADEKRKLELSWTGGVRLVATLAGWLPWDSTSE